MWFQGYADHVVGVELVEKAIQQFFSEHDLAYTNPTPDRYAAERLTLLHRDFFSLTPAAVGAIDLVYDRAAAISSSSMSCCRSAPSS